MAAEARVRPCRRECYVGLLGVRNESQLARAVQLECQLERDRHGGLTREGRQVGVHACGEQPDVADAACHRHGLPIPCHAGPLRQPARIRHADIQRGVIPVDGVGAKVVRHERRETPGEAQLHVVDDDVEDAARPFIRAQRTVDLQILRQEDRAERRTLGAAGTVSPDYVAGQRQDRARNVLRASPGRGDVG